MQYIGCISIPVALIYEKHTDNISQAQISRRHCYKSHQNYTKTLGVRFNFYR